LSDFGSIGLDTNNILAQLQLIDQGKSLRLQEEAFQVIVFEIGIAIFPSEYNSNQASNNSKVNYNKN